MNVWCLTPLSTIFQLQGISSVIDFSSGPRPVKIDLELTFANFFQ